MTKNEITQFEDEQLTKLRYVKDVREVMAAKPKMDAAPKNANGLALNINNGEKFGTWEWLKDKSAPVGYVYFEPVERIPDEI